VVGKQPWLDRIIKGPGVVRQVSKFLYIKGVPLFERFKVCCGSGYTVEEPVTGKVEIGAFSLIFFRVAQRLMGGFFGKEKKLSIEI
jgi:hypothetical protein